MNIDILYIVLVLVIVLISMTIHEAMHAYVGYWLGDKTAMLQGRLSFNPIKHIDPFMTILLPLTLALIGAPIFGGARPVPFNPHNIRWGEWGAALIALAGPITNFLIAFVVFGIWVIVGGSNQGLPWTIFSSIISVNLGFFVFNMIPIPPLDGSRVIYAIAPEFVRRGMEFLEQSGVIVVFALVLIAGPFIDTFMLKSINALLVLFMNFFGL